MPEKLETFQVVANEIASESDTDVIAYIGSVNTSAARRLVDLVFARRSRGKNLFFLLGTNGGDAHAAYKISRCLQHAYPNGTFTVGVYGDCKSAGTLIAIAAYNIVMCQQGELGPLDVQMQKDDRLFVRSSGLTTSQALESLKNEAFAQFEHFLLEIHDRTGYEISTKLATGMAIRMVTGLLGPIYQQIDPMRIGETQRAMDVATAYGNRLNVSQNLKDDALRRLIEKYPSHDFSIDFDEAQQLFHRLSRPNNAQYRLGQELAHLLLSFPSIARREPIVLYLNTEAKPAEMRTDATGKEESNAEKPTKISDAEHRTGGSKAKGANGRGRKPASRTRQREVSPSAEIAGDGAAPAASNGG